MKNEKEIKIGWFEEYGCGCVSEVVKLKKELIGYCAKHGNDRRQVFRVHPKLKSKGFLK